MKKFRYCTRKLAICRVNIDKKVTITGNPAIGAKIVVMTSFVYSEPAVTTAKKK